MLFWKNGNRILKSSPEDRETVFWIADFPDSIGRGGFGICKKEVGNEAKAKARKRNLIHQITKSTN